MDPTPELLFQSRKRLPLHHNELKVIANRYQNQLPSVSQHHAYAANSIVLREILLLIVSISSEAESDTVKCFVLRYFIISMY